MPALSAKLEARAAALDVRVTSGDHILDAGL